MPMPATGGRGSATTIRSRIRSTSPPTPSARESGGALLRTLIADCEALGFRQMVAVIGDSRHAASIALHQSEGFAVVGRLPTLGHKFGLWLDSVLMQRSLGPGAAQPPARPIR